MGNDRHKQATTEKVLQEWANRVNKQAEQSVAPSSPTEQHEPLLDNEPMPTSYIPTQAAFITLSLLKGSEFYKVDGDICHFAIDGKGYRFSVYFNHPMVATIDIGGENYRLVSEKAPSMGISFIYHANARGQWEDLNTLAIPVDHPILAFLKW